jgi:5-hydroxyisourate hydrolase-like protein (transthyretin family)
MKKLALFAILLMLPMMTAAGNKKPEQFSDVKFTVLRANNGKPVRNASIILHTVDEKGNQEQAGLELKTNEDGAASFDALPYGKLRVQVIAHGFQTYGEDFVIDQPTRQIVIKLEPPQRQYSIYDK